MSPQDPIQRATRQLARLPGVGEKTAQRLVYWLLRAPEGTASDIAAALEALQTEVLECSKCGDLSGVDPCGLCADTRREPGVVCVVEHPQDVRAFERSGVFRGRYHILHGALSPLDGIGPDQLRIQPLLGRLQPEDIGEVILATDPDVEGDATALYLARLLKPLGVTVSRLAHGIATGTEIEYADSASLGRALEQRRQL